MKTDSTLMDFYVRGGEGLMRGENTALSNIQKVSWYSGHLTGYF